MYHNGTFANRRMSIQHRLDFAKLNPAAANFNLIISAAEKFDIAVGTIARHVARAKETRLPVLGKRIGDEFFRGQFVTLDITAREAVAADADLAAHSDRHRLQLRIEQIDLRVVDRPADWNGSARVVFLGLVISYIRRDFRRAVKIDQLAIGQRAAEARRQISAERLAAAKTVSQPRQAPRQVRGLQDFS